MMNCIMIDDEPLARQGMAMLIGNMPNLKLIDSFSNPLDAISTLQNQPIDLLFLDINMPEMNGLDFMKSLKNAPLVIFTTAYTQYALDSYELDAIDYLLKPIRFERFVKAVNKAQNYATLLASKEETNNLIESISDDFIYIKSERKHFKVFFKEIAYIEGLKDYVIIHIQDRKVVTAMNLKTIHEQLPPKRFVRINKSYIVNTEHIVSFDPFNIYLSNIEIPIGTSFKDDFLRDYVEGKVMKKG
jgi:two-component system, LytTR family, response regulator